MNRRKLSKLNCDIEAARRSQVNASDLERLAKALGRRLGSRGKEPVWEHPELDVYPVAIPRHGGRDIALGTKNNILDSLEDDLLGWELRLDEEDEKRNDG